jgi:hypothetical protein
MEALTRTRGKRGSPVASGLKPPYFSRGIAYRPLLRRSLRSVLRRSHGGGGRRSANLSQTALIANPPKEQSIGRFAVIEIAFIFLRRTRRRLMLIPYTYRGFTVEGFYDEPTPDRCTYSVYVEFPPRLCQCAGIGLATWQQAMDAAETLIDEIIASWN